MKKIWLTGGIGVVLAALWFGLVHQPEPRTVRVATEVDLKAVEALLRSFDPVHPGRGISDYELDEAVDIPKSYAMVLMGELIRLRSGAVPEQPGLHRTAGRWLIDNARLDPAGHPGWGVPVAWDAYGDGSVNPAHTVYTISNAIVIEALLDWMEQDDAAPKEEIRTLLGAVIQPYLDPAMRSPSGLMPYSLRVSDRRYDTFNPAAYLAGQFQRLSWMVEPELGARLRAAADQTMAVLIRERQIDPRGNWYWYYSIQEKTPNDLPHAAYIIWGIRTYLDHGGRLASHFDWPRVRGHLRTFDRGAEFLHAWPDFRPSVKLPARSYDVGMALNLACRESELADLRARLLGTVPMYRSPDGSGYLKYPAQHQTKPLRVNEYEAYLYAGLMRCLDTAPMQPTAWLHADGATGKDVVPLLTRAESRLDWKTLKLEQLNESMAWAPVAEGMIPLAGFPASDRGSFSIWRALLTDSLWIVREDSAGQVIWRAPVEHTQGGKPVFRAAVHASGKLYLVYYDDPAQGNFLRIIPDTAAGMSGVPDPERLPPLRDPAGATYEMIPPIFMHLAADGTLHVAGGATYARRSSSGTWSEQTVGDCESVLETAWTDAGFALLCQRARPKPDSVFRIVAPGGIEAPPVEAPPAIPWNLRFLPGTGLTVEHARNPADLRRMLAFDLGRAAGMGWMELGIGNTESRIPWSQIYTLNGYLDLLFLARQSPDLAASFGWLVPAVRQRLDIEVRLLDRVWQAGQYHTRAFTVDRSPALFAVQTSRLLLLMHRYQTEVQPPRPLVSLQDLSNRVCTLDGHIETLAYTGQSPRWIAPGRAYLRWPRGSKFSFDGLNVPFNHQNEWAYAVLRAGQGEACSQARHAARDILAFFAERIMRAGRFPVSGEWDYWWGQAYDGWSKKELVSVNRPEYDGDHIKAWISFRTIDAMSVLAGLETLPASVREAAPDSARQLVLDGRLYPFAAYELMRRGMPVHIPHNVAARYVRVPAPWALQSAVWAHASLARSMMESVGRE